MEIERIFAEISSHIIEGVMFHEQMSDYYDFLNLHGYKRCHEYHCRCEMKNLRKIHRYYINHYNRLIQEDEIPNPKVIPSSWSKYARHEVDSGTKRTAVKDGIQRWYDWEKETKEFLESKFVDLMNENEIAASMKIKKLIRDVDHELKYACRKMIELASVDYDMEYIQSEQQRLHDKYKHR